MVRLELLKNVSHQYNRSSSIEPGQEIKKLLFSLYVCFVVKGLDRSYIKDAWEAKMLLHLHHKTFQIFTFQVINAHRVIGGLTELVENTYFSLGIGCCHKH